MTTSISTVTPSAVRVNGPRARTSLMTAIVEGGERARSTAAPRTAVASRAGGAHVGREREQRREEVDRDGDEHERHGEDAARAEEDRPEPLPQLFEVELAAGHERDHRERDLVDEAERLGRLRRQEVQPERPDERAREEVPRDRREPQPLEALPDEVRGEADDGEGDGVFQRLHASRIGGEVHGGPR